MLSTKAIFNFFALGVVLASGFTSKATQAQGQGQGGKLTVPAHWSVPLACGVDRAGPLERAVGVTPVGAWVCMQIGSGVCGECPPPLCLDHRTD